MRNDCAYLLEWRGSQDEPAETFCPYEDEFDCRECPHFCSIDDYEAYEAEMLFDF